MDIEQIQRFQSRIKGEWEDCRELADDDNYTLIVYCDILIGMALEAKEKLRWKKVTEEKPPINEWVQIKSRLGVVRIGILRSDEFIIWNTETGSYTLEECPEWREI